MIIELIDDLKPNVS